MKNELTTTQGFLALKEFNFAEALSEEMEGLTASFERIKIPAGGMTVFEIPGDNPSEPETVKEFSAVILWHHPLNAYYDNKYTGGSNPPDCGSFDGVVGIGTPGGECAKCPYNRFGSDENGSKACKNRRRIYLLREGEVFPLILSLPTGSLKDFSAFLMRQLSKGRKSNAFVTRFSLKKATSNSGIAFSQAQFAVDRMLTEEEYALVSGMTEQVKAIGNTVGYDMDEHATPTVDPVTGEVVTPLQ